ncbi:RagB/SusD family nutrient uptake outer membrane protein [Parapedobacter koreensis]|uniref:SusD family protein n=1 Tax=Parapedobacter koreensis TaxID=332977 RepID=A0A1H7K2W9_9SPHI|nr:RagB/SusD family nutrient uptake outer membrane protein [Parapedobacter koreensis]SEK80856.1 SusD family protein [Parapedobacter koreensis]
MKLSNAASLVFIVLSASCGREFLEVKSDVSIGTPSSISDYQALLDNSTAKMNIESASSLNIIGADEYFLESDAWHSLPTTNNSLQYKNAYTWMDDFYSGESGNDWNKAYSRILYANLVLEGIARVVPAANERGAWNNVKGSALFFRALNFYQLAQLFCQPYEAATADLALGIPLRLEPDVNLKSTRATVQQTYGQILSDLNESAGLLPDYPQVKMRPSKAAAYGLMARVCLSMQDYQQAGLFAREALDLHGDLMDYNELDPALPYPFPADYGETNVEVVFMNMTLNYPMFGDARMHVADDLLALYEPSDLRRSLFYATGTVDNIFFRGSFIGAGAFFAGIATPELFLISAEAHAREGSDEEALADLNRLREHRFAQGRFNPYRTADAETALDLVLEERRRELAFRGLRWEDLRRLNQTPSHAKTIERWIDGQRYTLEPNSVKYVWPIPDDVIALSGMEQNPR